jgi:hypothetical protein
MYRFSWPQTLAAFSAILSIILVIVVAIYLPAPSAFQFDTIRVVLALCGGAAVSVLPGMLELKFESTISKTVRVGGSLAVFILIYMLAPLVFRH